MKSTDGMEVRKRKRTLAATFFLIGLTILGVAYNAVRYPDRMPDAGYRMPDTIVRQGGMKTDSVYRSYVYGADKLVQEKKYDEALLLLDKAIAIRPNEATLRNKVIQVKAFAAQQKKDNEEFIRLMASADKYFSAKAYLDAKSTYQLALNLKPDDKNAQDKLNQT